MINTRLFHSRIINKYFETAQYLKNGAIPPKPKQAIEIWLSNVTSNLSVKNLVYLLGYKALMAFYYPFRKGFKAECGYGDCFNF